MVALQLDADEGEHGGGPDADCEPDSRETRQDQPPVEPVAHGNERDEGSEQQEEQRVVCRLKRAEPDAGAHRGHAPDAPVADCPHGQHREEREPIEGGGHRHVGA